MVKISTEKLNSAGFKIVLFLAPFIILLSGSFNYLISLTGSYNTSAAFLLIAFHLVFLLSLTSVISNIFIEIFLSLLDYSSKSCVCDTLYRGRQFIPFRSFLFVAVFIAAYIILCQSANQSAIHALILIVPPIAILFNAPRFLSRRIRCINGSYIIYSGHFKTVFSYYANDDGCLCVIFNDGKTLDTGISIAETDFKKLENEFEKNSLSPNNK